MKCPFFPELVSSMVVEPISLFSAGRKAGRGWACEDDGNRVVPNGNSSNQPCGPNDAPRAEVVRGRTRERCSMVSRGSWAPGRKGANCPRDIRRTWLAVAVSGRGWERASWSPSGVSWRKSCRPAEDCHWRRFSSAPPSRRQESGPRGGAHPAWRRGESHRSRRGSQSCSRRYYRERFAARRPTCRSRPRPQLPRLPPAVIDQRASRRQQPPGLRSGGESRHRDNRTPSRRAPHPDRERSSLASVPNTLVSGATGCLAASFSSAGDRPGVPRRNVLRHGLSRL
jgi:hypothetical protein